MEEDYFVARLLLHVRLSYFQYPMVWNFGSGRAISWFIHADWSGGSKMTHPFFRIISLCLTTRFVTMVSELKLLTIFHVVHAFKEFL